MLPKTELALSIEALRGKAIVRPASSERKKPTLSSERHFSTSTSTSRSSESEESVRNSSPATSEGDSSDQPDDDAGSRKNHDASATSTAVEIVPRSKLTGFVLFGVHGSKRLQNACLRLAQIDVAVCKDDDSFFDEMTVQYKKLRGFLRLVLSIWVFQTCEFIMVWPPFVSAANGLKKISFTNRTRTRSCQVLRRCHFPKIETTTIMPVVILQSWVLCSTQTSTAANRRV